MIGGMRGQLADERLPRKRDTRVVLVSEVKLRGEHSVTLYGVVRNEGEEGLLFGPARWREVQKWRKEHLRP